jgi:hypothetical protein
MPLRQVTAGSTIYRFVTEITSHDAASGTS